MSLSIFGEKAEKPTEDTLHIALGESKTLWDEIKNLVESACGDYNDEWKYYTKKAGWSFVVRSGKRTILYLIPQDKFFKVNIVLGDKAIAAAQDASLPEAINALIMGATPYVEGRSIMFDIGSLDDVDSVRKLVRIKAEK
ncbi:MAG: DUF3788 domain-containing protein [Synergistaceae bacterium]|nr:DUF3788 domain-containing protein [Synergistaceae bacterium]